MTAGAAAGRPAPGAPTASDLALLSGLVAIPSVSGAEAAAAAWLAAAMRARGLSAALDAAGNVVGVAEPVAAPRAGDLYCLGHVDTVPGFWPPRTAGGRLTGRGASDAKGPLAAFVAAAARARASGRLRRRVWVLGAVEEEGSSRGAHHLAATLPAPAFLVVGEPSGAGRVVLGYRGRLQATLAVRQPARHSSRRDPTAAERALALWPAVQALAAELGPGPGEFGAVGAHLVAVEHSGDGLTDTGRLRLDFRLPPPVPPGLLAGRLRALDPAAELTVEGAQAAVTVPRQGPLPAAFARAIRATGPPVGWLRRLGSSDLNVVLPAWGCPAVVYGPGDSALDHTPEESIALADYGRAITVLTEVLLTL